MTTLSEPRLLSSDGTIDAADRPGAYSPLVLTKIRVPKPRPRVVDRARLLASLDSPDAGLILVSAPAGYGKTTVLAAWTQSRAGAGTAVAWYSLDSSDNDSIPFGSYLVASLSQALGATDELSRVAQLLRSSPEVDLLKIMSAIINAVVESEQECVLALDDYHLISAPPIHHAITFLLERRPDNLRVAICTRSDPPLPIAKLRAQGKVAELRAADLRFTRQECAEFLSDVMQLEVKSDLVEALETRTEGWIVGLQLAALSLAGRTVDTDLISSLQGNSRFLIQYLLEEVVSRQSSEVQEFLLSTSVLDRLCAPLCDALLAQAGSDQILDQLERANLFLVPLDEQGFWYRYHHLFREFLRARLNKGQPERVFALNRRASEWHEGQGHLREAVRYALGAHDWDYAAELVERHGMATLMHSEISTVYEWCKAFPQDVLRKHPYLCVVQGWTLVLGYRRDYRERVEQTVRMAEEVAATLPDRVHARWLAGQAAAVRTFSGNVPDPHVDARGQLAVAQRALDLLDPGEPLRSTTMLTVGYGYLALQEQDRAYAAFEEARTLSMSGNNYYGATDARFQQARLAHEQGDLRRVAELCRQGRAEIAAVIAQPEQEVPAIGSLDIALGCARLEQNRLTEAEPLLLRGLDIVGLRTGIPYYRFIACVALARLREIQGRHAEAGAFLNQLEDLWPDVTFCVEALRTMQTLRTDQSRDQIARTRAVSWSEAFARSLGDELPLPGMGPLGASEPYYVALLAWARARIAAGAPRQALDYLEPQLGLALAHDLKARIIELSLFEALALTALGDDRHSLASVARAVDLAEPEGFVRIFDEGLGASRLLAQAAHRGVARDYIDHLLHAIAPGPDNRTDPAAAAPAKTVRALVEPLTDRELEVLRLLDSGLLNRQIAEELIISIGTVKRHTANIYGKLGVETRTQAIVRARSLSLL